MKRILVFSILFFVILFTGCSDRKVKVEFKETNTFSFIEGDKSFLSSLKPNEYFVVERTWMETLPQNQYSNPWELSKTPIAKDTIASYKTQTGKQFKEFRKVKLIQLL